MLGTGVNVALGLLLGKEQAGGLNDVLGAQLLPGQVVGIALGADGDALAVDDDVIALRLHLTVKLAVHGVVLQHIGQVIGRTQIVDTHDLDFRVVNGPADHHTADAAKAVDSNFNTHFESSPSRWNISNIWYILYYTLFS